MLLLEMLWSFSPVVSLEADKTNIYPGEKVVITLSVIAKKEDEKKIKFVHQEKLSGLKIIKRGGEDSYDTIADGNKQIDVVEKKIFYTIKPSKKVTIKPLNLFVGDREYKTNSVTINIIKDTTPPKKVEKKPKPLPKPSMKDIKKAIKITLSSNKKEVAQFEPLIITVKATEPLDAPISNVEYKDPSFKDFQLIKKVEKTQNSKKSLIRVIRYILLPKKSGLFSIEPAQLSFTLNMAPAMVASFGFFNSSMQVESVRSNPLKIKVNKVPTNVDIIGNYKIETKINKKIVHQNEQVVYNIIIKGEGNLDELELPKLSIDNVTIYQEEPLIKKELVGDKFLTIYKQKYVFIAKNSFTIPSIRIKAYSPRFKRIYMLSTKPIDILVNSTAPTLLQKTTLKSTPSSKESKEELEAVVDTAYYKKRLQEANSKEPLMIAFSLGLFLGIFGVLFIPKMIRLIRYKNEKTPLYSSYNEALHILYPHTTKSKEYEEMVAMLYEIINGNKEIKIDTKKLNRLIKAVKEDSL